MPKYRAYATVTGSKYLGVFEAENEDDAMKKALESDAAYISLCWHCSTQCESPQVDEVEIELADDEEEGGPDANQA